MSNDISCTRLRRSIGRHLHKHSRSEIGNAKRQSEKDWGEDGGFDRGSCGCASEYPAE
jgi:hypothetical protein